MKKIKKGSLLLEWSVSVLVMCFFGIFSTYSTAEPQRESDPHLTGVSMVGNLNFDLTTLGGDALKKSSLVTIGKIKPEDTGQVEYVVDTSNRPIGDTMSIFVTALCFGSVFFVLIFWFLTRVSSVNDLGERVNNKREL